MPKASQNLLEKVMAESDEDVLDEGEAEKVEPKDREEMIARQLLQVSFDTKRVAFACDLHERTINRWKQGVLNIPKNRQLQVFLEAKKFFLEIKRLEEALDHIFKGIVEKAIETAKRFGT